MCTGREKYLTVLKISAGPRCIASRITDWQERGLRAIQACRFDQHTEIVDAILVPDEEGVRDAEERRTRQGIEVRRKDRVLVCSIDLIVGPACVQNRGSTQRRRQRPAHQYC